MSSPLRAGSDSSAAHRHKPILADRFKTKLCRTFCETGVCPYEERCMFAHGEEDLRSKEMNLEEKLTTEDAIRQFQRARAEAKGCCDNDGSSTSAMSPAVPTPHSAVQKEPQLKAECTATALALGAPRVSAAAAIGERFVAALRRPSALDVAALSEPGTMSPATAATPAARVVTISDVVAFTPASQPETVACLESPAVAASPSATKPRAAARVYRHNPYAPVTLGWGAPMSEQSQQQPRRGMVSSGVTAVACAPTYAARAYAAAAPRCEAAPLPPTMRLSGPRHSVSPACVAAPAPLMSTYGPKTTYCAAAVPHEVLLA